jgi:hypothetical protein
VTGGLAVYEDRATNETLTVSRRTTRAKKWKSLRRRVKISWDVVCNHSDSGCVVAIFHYYPMYGVQIAFGNLCDKGITEAPGWDLPILSGSSTATTL